MGYTGSKSIWEIQSKMYIDEYAFNHFIFSFIFWVRINSGGGVSSCV